MKVGEEVEITTERKGNFDRITSINGSGGMPHSPVGGAGSPASSSSGPTKKEEIPVSMKVAWAKDLLVGGTVATAKDAVELINEVVKEFKVTPDPLAQPQ